VQALHIKFCEKLVPLLLHEYVTSIDFDRKTAKVPRNTHTRTFSSRSRTLTPKPIG